MTLLEDYGEKRIKRSRKCMELGLPNFNLTIADCPPEYTCAIPVV